jgi:hypothetical protein
LAGLFIYLESKSPEQSIESKFAGQNYLMTFCIFPAHFISREKSV